MEQLPSNIDLHASQQPRILASNIIAVCLAVISVALRFLSRRLAGTALWWDDWLMIPPVLLLTAIFICCPALLLPNGFGKHVEVAGAEGVKVSLEVLFFAEISYTITITFVKFSILAFYWRIFNVAPIRVPIYLLAAITGSWGIACLFMNIFECVPVAGFWDKSIQAHCGVNDNQFFFGQSIPNIVTDAAIIVLPIRFIWDLHTPRIQKALLTAMFVAGGLVVAISIARLTYLVHNDSKSEDVTWNFVDIEIWTMLELGFAILSGCLPSLRPIVVLFLNRSTESAHRSSENAYDIQGSGGAWRRVKLRATSRSQNAKGTKDSDDRNLFADLSNSWDVEAPACKISGPAEPAFQLQDMDEREGIQVRQDIEVYR